MIKHPGNATTNPGSSKNSNGNSTNDLMFKSNAKSILLKAINNMKTEPSVLTDQDAVLCAVEQGNDSKDIIITVLDNVTVENTLEPKPEVVQLPNHINLQDSKMCKVEVDDTEEIVITYMDESKKTIKKLTTAPPTPIRVKPIGTITTKHNFPDNVIMVDNENVEIINNGVNKQMRLKTVENTKSTGEDILIQVLEDTDDRRHIKQIEPRQVDDVSVTKIGVNTATPAGESRKFKRQPTFLGDIDDQYFEEPSPMKMRKAYEICKKNVTKNRSTLKGLHEELGGLESRIKTLVSMKKELKEIRKNADDWGTERKLRDMKKALKQIWDEGNPVEENISEDNKMEDQT